MTTRWAEFQGRIEDDRLVQGNGAYVADLALPGMAHGVVVRAQVAHAALKGVDVSAAMAAPGVLAVLTAKDLAADGVQDFPSNGGVTRADGSKPFPARRPVLARERIRMVGEPVAFVVAETLAEAEAAAELVAMQTDDLPVVVDHFKARGSDAPKVWPEVADNVAFVWRKGDLAAARATAGTAAHVAKLSSHVSRVAAMTLEPRGCVGEVDASGRLVLHAANQSPHILKSAIAGMMKVPADTVRIVARDVGGSFGMKSGAYPEDILCLVAARRLKRPVRWISERRESFLSDDHGRDISFDGELALDKDGNFLALGLSFACNIGAYLTGRSTYMVNNIGGIAGVYRIPQIAAEVTGIFTNTGLNAPYRGAGRPEATYALERLIDIAARDLGVDPFDLRLKNLVPPSAMPYDTGFVFKYDCGEFEGTMRGAARVADYAGFAARRNAAAKRGKLLGLGMANPIEVAAGPFTKVRSDTTRIDIHDDGTATLYAGSMSTGQGIETTLTDLVAKQLGLPREAIRYEAGDTDDLADGRGNGGSGAIPVGGAATLQAAHKVIATGKALAAELLDARPDDIDFKEGRFPLRGTNRSVGLADVAKRAKEKNPSGLSETAIFMPPAVTFPNGSHMCEVEVDPETGVVRIVRYSIVEDIGTVLNDTLAFGQIQGGVAMGVGQALGELIVYDGDTAQLMTGSFMDYQMPRADDVPQVHLETRPVPTKVNPLGAKGVGEAGTVGSLVATVNAVCNALAPYGIKHIEMPMTPARVWAAIEAAKANGLKSRPA